MKLTIGLIIVTFLIISTPCVSFSGIIFEDDFSDDAGWSGASTAGSWNESNQPSKWSAYKVATSNSSLDIIAGAGKNGTPALRLGYEITNGQALAIGLGKHLTGNRNTGYSELYIRYQVKFADNWISGDGTVAPWKWWRLWQYRPPTNINSFGEHDDPKDTRFFVGTFSNNPPTWGIMANDNQNSQSTGGSHITMKYSGTSTCLTCGHFESMPGWSFDGSGNWDTTPQTWHTVEWRIKLSSAACPNQDGVMEVWFDGIKQTQSFNYSDKYGANTDCLGNGVPTVKYQSGINYLIVFDNMFSWSKNWGSTKRYIYLDNVVVSDAYIGPSYPDATPPAPPTNLR